MWFNGEPWFIKHYSYKSYDVVGILQYNAVVWDYGNFKTKLILYYL